GGAGGAANTGPGPGRAGRCGGAWLLLRLHHSPESLIYIEGIRLSRKKEGPRNANLLGPLRWGETGVRRRGYASFLTSNAEPLPAAARRSRLREEQPAA